MRFCKIQDGAIVEYAIRLPRKAPLLRTGQPIDNLAELGPVMWSACGWHQIRRTARPQDTETTTWESTHEIIDGVPTQVWVEVPAVPEKREPSLDAAAQVLTARGEIPALDDLTEEEAEAVSAIFPELQTGMNVQADWVFRWGDTLVEIVQPHRVSLDEWTPDTALTLYRKHRKTGTAEWEDGAAYKVDEEVTFNGRRYRCRIAHTAWKGAGYTPVAYAAGWIDLGPV